MKTAFKKLGSPIFILPVLILILNDWVFKTQFHNTITGKLSDFVGLFAFALFTSAFIKKYRRTAHITIALLFMVWNSPLVEPFIFFVNDLGIPIGRTVDYSDNVALIVLPLSYFIFERLPTISLQPLLLKSVLVISVLAFCATSLPPRDKREYLATDKQYDFNFSKERLVSKINSLQIKYIRQASKYGVTVFFDQDKNIFHLKNNKDTLAMLLDSKQLNEKDTIRSRSILASFQISGNGRRSKLKLLSVFWYPSALSKKDYKKRAIKRFEKKFIKKLKKRG